VRARAPNSWDRISKASTASDVGTPACEGSLGAYTVSIISRPSREVSLITRIWNGGRCFSALIRRRYPSRFANSAPEIPSSRTTEALVDGPAAALGLLSRVFDLARDGARLLDDAGLVAALAGVDRGNHGVTRG
jgi:hypothetical protein